MSEQRIEIVFFNLENNDGSHFVEAEVSVDGSIVFEVREPNLSLTNTARAIIKKFGERTRVWTRWEYQAEYWEREARYWDCGNGGPEPVLMSPVNRLC